MAVFILSATRTPYGAFGGALRRIAPEQLAAWAIQAALEPTGLAPDAAEVLILGQALRYGGGANPAGRAARCAGLRCPAWAVDQGRASGFAALLSGLHALESGALQRIVVAAADSASSVPYLLPEGRWGHRLGQSTALDPLILEAPELEEAYREAVALKERELQIINESLLKWASRPLSPLPLSKEECCPLTLPGRRGPTRLELDECREGVDPDPRAYPWPLPPLADGAAALVLSGGAHGSGCRIAGFRQALGEGPTEGLLGAVLPLLAEANLEASDLDQVEVDESLPLSLLALFQALPGLDPQRVNPGGGALSLGQAQGTEGLRLLVSLFHGLERIQGRFGLAAMETTDGLGMAILLERNPA